MPFRLDLHMRGLAVDILRPPGFDLDGFIGIQPVMTLLGTDRLLLIRLPAPVITYTLPCLRRDADEIGFQIIMRDLQPATSGNHDLVDLRSSVLVAQAEHIQIRLREIHAFPGKIPPVFQPLPALPCPLVFLGGLSQSSNRSRDLGGSCCDGERVATGYVSSAAAVTILASAFNCNARFAVSSICAAVSSVSKLRQFHKFFSYSQRTSMNWIKKFIPLR